MICEEDMITSETYRNSVICASDEADVYVVQKEVRIKKFSSASIDIYELNLCES